MRLAATPLPAPAQARSNRSPPTPCPVAPSPLRTPLRTWLSSPAAAVRSTGAARLASVPSRHRPDQLGGTRAGSHVAVKYKGGGRASASHLDRVGGGRRTWSWTPIHGHAKIRRRAGHPARPRPVGASSAVSRRRSRAVNSPPRSPGPLAAGQIPAPELAWNVGAASRTTTTFPVRDSRRSRQTACRGRLGPGGWARMGTVRAGSEHPGELRGTGEAGAAVPGGHDHHHAGKGAGGVAAPWGFLPASSKIRSTAGGKRAFPDRFRLGPAQMCGSGRRVQGRPRRCRARGEPRRGRSGYEGQLGLGTRRPVH